MFRMLSSIGASNRVVAYTVHEPFEPAGDAAKRADQLVFVKDGFNWWAFFIAPLWMLANRMWLVFIGYLVVSAAIGGLFAFFQVDMTWAGLASLALNMIVAFEADSLQRWTLERKGWRMVGVVSGANMRECERRFFERWVESFDGQVEQGVADGKA